MKKHGTHKAVEVGLKRVPYRYRDSPMVDAFRRALEAACPQ